MAISPISGSGFSILSLQSQLRKFRAEQLGREQAITRTGFTQKKNTENRTGGVWETVRSGIGAAVDHLGGVIARVEIARGFIRKLADLETRARTGSASEIADFARKFDDTLRKLNALTNAMSQEPNLIGSNFANDFQYINDITGGQATFSYADLSSSYTITDAGGNIFRKGISTDRFVVNGIRVEDSSNDATLIQYDSSGVATGKSAVITLELRVDSLSGSSIDFTIKPGTADEETFNGATITRTGLNVLDASFYAGLTTAAGRATAAADIEVATAAIDGTLGAFKAALARAEFDQGFSGFQASTANSNISDLNQQQLLALQESTDRVGRENEAFAFAVSRNAGLRASYLNLFKTPALGASIDIIS